jgi:hypothetical protein
MSETTYEADNMTLYTYIPTYLPTYSTYLTYYYLADGRTIRQRMERRTKTALNKKTLGCT